MTPRGLLFDFDGVLIESEFAGNRQLAEWLTDAGYPTTPEDSMANFMGLAGHDFRTAIEAWIGGPIPASFDAARDEEDARAMEGLEAAMDRMRAYQEAGADLLFIEAPTTPSSSSNRLRRPSARWPSAISDSVPPSPSSPADRLSRSSASGCSGDRRTALTAFSAASRLSNRATTVPVWAGNGRRRKVTSTITPRVPRLPI